MKLRVYGKLRNVVKGVEVGKSDVRMVPYASLEWLTSGGPYRWDNTELEVYMNGVKMPKYTAPKINCGSSPAITTYTLKHKNPPSSSLLRPA